jgi:hypothetical protein
VLNYLTNFGRLILDDGLGLLEMGKLELRLPEIPPVLALGL